ncbi:Flagellar basal body-associated protein FliL [Micromonospora sediminicola]|uniref:Flagellar basal body-associated protein FliL n=1 Tax=Micromonospora sediminicola TaxID=946078 RepID=A0A1A9B3F4_9ACTN|nr:flagellar basal body protein FliL [Micromonospora sediminicola]SBT63571.1 Flagellar basal body-associated protein FliL [Micromonospora sediminicola]
MSNFGPPGGGSPEPWGGRRPDDGYAPQPADPHYGPAPGGPQYGPPQQYGPPTEQYGVPPQQYGPPTQQYEPAAPGWAPGPPQYQGYPADPGYGGQPPYAGGQPPYAGGEPPYAEPTPPKRGKGPLLVVVLVVLAVLLLGGAGAYWLLGRNEKSPTAGTTAATAPAADPTAAAPSDPAEATPTAPAPASSTDPRFVKAGQCVANEGGGGQPKLVIADCAPKTYQVLRRIDGATSGKKDAEAKCGKVTGYTDWYFFDSELDTLDFVLCLKRR